MKGIELSDLSNKAMGCVIEVHKTLYFVPMRYVLKSYKLSRNQYYGFVRCAARGNEKQGFLINFYVKLLKQGLKNFVL